MATSEFNRLGKISGYTFSATKGSSGRSRRVRHQDFTVKDLQKAVRVQTGRNRILHGLVGDPADHVEPLIDQLQAIALYKGIKVKGGSRRAAEQLLYKSSRKSKRSSRKSKRSSRKSKRSFPIPNLLSGSALAVNILERALSV
jgi:hypothetical protein